MKCEKALKDLKQDDSIETLTDDKGRISVVLDDDTWHYKMKTLIKTGVVSYLKYAFTMGMVGTTASLYVNYEY